MAAAATCLGLTVLVAPGANASTSASDRAAASGASRVVTAIDVAKLQVSYRGKLMTSAQTQALQTARERARRQFVVVYDPASAAAGIAHAFDSRAAAEAYGATVKAGLRAAATRGAGHTAVTTKRSVAVTTLSLPSGCPDAKNISRMYDYTSCGGSSFSWLLSDLENDLGTYGWNNRASSAVLGWTTSLCSITLRLFPGPNRTYTAAYFYGGGSTATYYSFSSAINNNAESGDSTCS
jgi:hypothetical protein